MRRKRRVFNISIILTLLFALSVTACGQAETPTEEPAEPTSVEQEIPATDAVDLTEPEPTEPPVDAPESILRIGTIYSVSTFDPIKSAAAGDIEVLGQLYSRLLKRPADGSELQPGLAESWDASDDGLVYTFHLRDAQFSDGTPITADDVVFSFLRLRDQEDSAYANSFQPIETVEAIDERTVRFTLNLTSSAFLTTVEMFNAGIVPQAYVEEVGDEEFGTNPITSGPFQVREWLPNDRTILEANPHYWREGYPRVDAVEVIEVANDSTRISMLEAGEIDVAREIPWITLREWESVENFSVPYNPSSVINVVLLNHQSELISDIRTREAMTLALDSVGITEAVTFGNGKPANSLIPDKLRYYNADLPIPPYDPELARDLVEEAGLEGSQIRLMVVAGDSIGEQITILMQNQLAAVGFNPEIEQVDLGTWWDRLVNADYDATASWWYNEMPDPDAAIRWALCGSCGTSSFFTFYQNDDLDALVDPALAETDPEIRQEMYYEIQQIALDDYAQIPLYYQPYRNAMRTNVNDFMMSPWLQWSLEEASIER